MNEEQPPANKKHAYKPTLGIAYFEKSFKLKNNVGNVFILCIYYVLI